jgi:uncharacterized protein
MADVDAPKIEFPCANYPIKVVGDASAHFRDFVLAVMAKHDPSFDPTQAHVRPSRKGNYMAVNVMVTATSPNQLGDIFTELKANPAVRLVL